MKNHLLLCSSILLASCYGKSNNRLGLNKESPAIDQMVSVNKVVEEIDNLDTSDWVLFTHHTPLDYDSLKVRWINQNKIEFRFISGDSPCTFEQKGIANKLKTGDSEIDEDENGLAYPSDEYFVEDGGQFISVRIENGKSKMARIRYQYHKPADECDPDDSKILRR